MATIAQVIELLKTFPQNAILSTNDFGMRGDMTRFMPIGLGSITLERGFVTEDSTIHWVTDEYDHEIDKITEPHKSVQIVCMTTCLLSNAEFDAIPEYKPE